MAERITDTKSFGKTDRTGFPLRLFELPTAKAQRVNLSDGVPARFSHADHWYHGYAYLTVPAQDLERIPRGLRIWRLEDGNNLRVLVTPDDVTTGRVVVYRNGHEGSSEPPR
jgi:hypothetical protein